MYLQQRQINDLLRTSNNPFAIILSMDYYHYTGSLLLSTFDTIFLLKTDNDSQEKIIKNFECKNPECPCEQNKVIKDLCEKLHCDKNDYIMFNRTSLNCDIYHGKVPIVFRTKFKNEFRNNTEELRSLVIKRMNEYKEIIRQLEKVKV